MSIDGNMTAVDLTFAHSKAFRTIERDPAMVATERSAGFVFPVPQPKGHRTGYQVFVRVCRYSDELLAAQPESGGLLENAK